MATHAPGWARQTFANLTLEQKVGQVICFRAHDHADETIDMARRGLVGSVSPGYYANTTSRESIVAFMNALQEASPVPILFLSNFAASSSHWGSTPFPGEQGAMAIGATRDPAMAYTVGRASAIESKAMGIDCVWTPCVDVNTNPGNPIIGTRAFADQPELVVDMALPFVLGMQDAGLIPNAKHFPGHGDTGFDTHREIGVVPHSRERLEQVELYPYRRLIDAGLRGVETAHLIFPALDDESNGPATFSRRCIYDLLRTDMGFEGLIVSDSLTMRAIKDHYSVAESVTRTFNAGHDIVLQDYDEPPMPTFDCLLSAVQEGAVPMAELDASVMRVLEAKEWAGLPERGPIDEGEIAATFQCTEHLDACRALYQASVTVVEDDLLPLARGSGGKTCVMAIRSPDEGRSMTDMVITMESGRQRLYAECQARLGEVRTHDLPEIPTGDDAAAALAAAADCDTVIFATMPHIVAYGELSGRVDPGQPAVVEQLLAAGKQVALCVFGTPYAITSFPRAQATLTTYSSKAPAIEAGVGSLFGEIVTRGRLPIALSASYPFGYGL